MDSPARIGAPRVSTPARLGTPLRVPSFGLEVVASASAFEQLGGAVSDEYLRHHCGVDDLEEVQKLEISVNADEQPIETLGTSCPFLLELKLQDSCVRSIRDIGTGLKYLKVLWLSRAGLADLCGMSALPVLEELYVSFNEIDDLCALSYHDKLQVLDLEGNNIASWSELENLDSLPELRELNVQGNPFCKDSYAKRVIEMLPNVEMLDDQIVATMEFSDGDPSPAKHGVDSLSAEASTEAGPEREPEQFGDEPDEDLLLLEQIKSLRRRQSALGGTSSARPATSAGAPHWLGPSSAPPSFRPSTAWVAPAEEAQLDENPFSELTQGSEGGVSGNPLNLVRHRRKAAPRPEDGSLDIRSLLERYRTFCQPSCLSDAELAARKLDAEQRPRTGQVAVRISRGRPMTAAMIAAMSDDAPGEKAPAPTRIGEGEVFVVD